MKYTLALLALLLLLTTAYAQQTVEKLDAYRVKVITTTTEGDGITTTTTVEKVYTLAQLTQEISTANAAKASWIAERDKPYTLANDNVTLYTEKADNFTTILQTAVDLGVIDEPITP